MSTAPIHRIGRSDLEWDLLDRLAKALRVAGMRPAEMAAYLHVHRNTVSSYLHGRTDPDYATLIVWARRTGVPLAWLTGARTEEPAQVTHEKDAVRRVGNVLYPAFGRRPAVEHEHLAPVVNLSDRRQLVRAA